MLMDSALHRIPVLAETGIKKFYNGPESFTPDNQFILGEAPELRNFFVAAGFNSVGIASAGGAGLALAEWIIEGQPASDLTAVDIRRFARFNGNNQLAARPGRRGTRAALRDAVAESRDGDRAAVPPVAGLSPAAGRERLLRQPDGLGAGELLRPARGASAAIEYCWGKQNWLPWSAAEQRATRTGGGRLRPDVVLQVPAGRAGRGTVLQWLCTADVAVRPGRTVYTGMLNDRGTYESDITVTRLSAEEFLLVSQRRDDRAGPGPHHRRGSRADARATLVDVTSSYAVYGVMGPRSTGAAVAG